MLATFPNLAGLGRLDVPEDKWEDEPLPTLPPQVKHGVLANGLSWYVHENREPKARAELFLVVPFGSLVEAEEERGIAHIIEHLGFSATKAYENHAIVKFLESIGAPFGACQNAYTSFDRTVYTLHVPTDKDNLLEESLTVLREFAYYTRIAEGDLEKERKVVLEEWRESKNAEGRLFEDYINALCKGCLWCERLPIGKEDVIKNVSAETLRKFYSKFYHPARMSVIAVGDFDENHVIQKIKELFEIDPTTISPLPRSAEAPERPFHSVPDTPGIVVASSTDPELSYGQGVIDCKRPREAPKTLKKYKRRAAEMLFHRAFASRTLKLTMEPRGTRNYFSASTGTSEPVPVLSPMQIAVSPLPGRMRYALQSVAEEIERVRRHGFRDGEVKRAKRSMLAETEIQYIEREQRASDSIAEEYVSYILDGNPIPGIEEEAKIVATLVPSITTQEVSEIAKLYDFSQNVVVKIATPPLSVFNPTYTGWSLAQSMMHLRVPRPRMDLPNSSEVAELLKFDASQEIEPWPEDVDDVDSRMALKCEACADRRLPRPPIGSSSYQRRVVECKGVPIPKRGESLEWEQSLDTVYTLGEEIILQNGLRVFLKSTNLFDDEIVLSARRWGGNSQHISQGGMFSSSVVSCEAQTCNMVAMMLGICGLSVESLQECLEGRRVDPNPPELGHYWTDTHGSTSPSDIEVMLQLLHLLFMYPVEPHATSAGRLSLVKLGLLAWRLSQNRDPDALFQQRMQEMLTQNHPVVRLPTLWSILRMNFGKACEIFNERLDKPSEWTFVFIGKLPPLEKLMPLLELYLGSIPDSGGGEGHTPCDINDFAAIARREVQLRQAVTPLNVQWPKQSSRNHVRLKMMDPKGNNVIVFPVTLKSVGTTASMEEIEADLERFFMLRVIGRMLETRLIELLRFKRGQVYGVRVMDDFSFSPPVGDVRTGALSISFECNPVEADDLIFATLAELDRLRSGEAAFTDDNAKAAKEQERRELEESFHRNEWWVTMILSNYFSRSFGITGDMGATMSVWWRTRMKTVETLTAEKAMACFHEVLPQESVNAIFMMCPKGKVMLADASPPANGNEDNPVQDNA